MIDLHIHTAFSDGQNSPNDVVVSAKNIGVVALAITDHDTVKGVDEGRFVAERLGLQFISGIEISCTGNREIHLLGYNIDINDHDILSACENHSLFRRERALKIIKYLEGSNIFLDLDEVSSLAGYPEVIGRMHFALAMVKKEYVKSTREAFDKYLGTREFDKIERPKPSIKDGINMILSAGGKPVLAHPALLRLSDEGLEDFVKMLVGYGLRGIECHYSLHSQAQSVFYCNLARKYNLLVTGGSDFHGEKFKPGVKIGTGVNGSLSFNDNKIVDLLLE